MRISQVQQILVAAKDKRISELEALVKSIQEALNTQETGEELIEVVRNAHKCEIGSSRIRQDSRLCGGVSGTKIAKNSR